MKTNYSTYNYVDGCARIDAILDQPELNYRQLESLPPRETLTLDNGFYSYCCALFTDMRRSSSLTSKYSKPLLAKIYRAYISEVVAVLNANVTCSEINIVGDGVWAVFNTMTKRDVTRVFATAAQIGSVVKMLNGKLRKRGIDEVKVGIGMSYGQVLIVKAGFGGSDIDEIVYMGDVVNEAAKLAAYGHATRGDGQLMVSRVSYGSLSESNKTLLSWSASRRCYQGTVTDTRMDDWYESNCT